MSKYVASLIAGSILFFGSIIYIALGQGLQLWKVDWGHIDYIVAGTLAGALVMVYGLINLIDTIKIRHAANRKPS